MFQIYGKYHSQIPIDTQQVEKYIPYISKLTSFYKM
jgi:hypothetical protein